MQQTQEIQVPSLRQEDPLEQEMATHCSILAWKTPWTEDPGRLQSKGSQRVRHNWAHTYTLNIKKWLFLVHWKSGTLGEGLHPLWSLRNQPPDSCWLSLPPRVKMLGSPPGTDSPRPALSTGPTSGRRQRLVRGLGEGGCGLSGPPTGADCYQEGSWRPEDSGPFLKNWERCQLEKLAEGLV